LLSKIFKKPSILVLGGYDVTYIPEYNYGSFNKKFRAFCTKFSIKNANKNLAVSEYVKQEALYRVPSASIQIIYNAIEIDAADNNEISKEDLIMTVGLVNNRQRMKIKGIDRFYNIALKMPEYQFVIIGVQKENFNFEEKGNIKILPKVSHEELMSYYKRAKVYCQLSVVESFGMSIVEAMYHKCAAVITDVGGLREVAGENAIYVDRKSDNEIISGIKDAIDNHKTYGEKGPEIVKNRFSLERRKEKLFPVFRNATP
jgi:glycosyltransferase involved in cell wall biosynthesis